MVHQTLIHNNDKCTRGSYTHAQAHIGKIHAQEAEMCITVLVHTHTLKKRNWGRTNNGQRERIGDL